MKSRNDNTPSCQSIKNNKGEVGNEIKAGSTLDNEGVENSSNKGQ